MTSAEIKAIERIRVGAVVEVWLHADGARYIALADIGWQGFNVGQSHGGATIGTSANDAAERASRIFAAVVAHKRDPRTLSITVDGNEYRMSITARRDNIASTYSGTSRWGLGVHPANTSRPPVVDPRRTMYFAIDPSDSTALPRECVALWSAVAGDAAVMFADGTTDTISIGPTASVTAVSASGARLAYVKSTGTTATQIVAIADGVPIP